MPRPRRLLRFTDITPDGRRFFLEEVPRGRRPQVRTWDSTQKRYRRMTLDTSLRDANGRPNLQLIRNALDVAKVAIVDSFAATATSGAATGMPPSLGAALDIATNPDTTVARDTESDQHSEWVRAAKDARSVLDLTVAPDKIGARHATTVAKSALLRIAAQRSTAEWRSIVQPLMAERGESVASDATLRRAYQAAVATAADATKDAQAPSAAAAPRGGAVVEQRQPMSLTGARRTAQLFRAMLRHAAVADHDAYGTFRNMSLAPSLDVDLRNLADAEGIRLREDPHRPRHPVRAARALLRLVMDPRYLMWSALASVCNGEGAYRVRRSDMQIDGAQVIVRVNVGGRKKVAWNYRTLGAAESSIVGLLLHATYAAFEAEYQSAGVDYDLLRGHTWTGERLEREDGAELPGIDPRWRLLLDLGVEGRLGQIRRAYRSHVRRVGDSGDLALAELGRRTKPSGTHVLSAAQQADLGFALEVGHLADLELAYRAGELADYPLAPQGRLKNGRVPLTGAVLKPVDEKTLNGWAHELEAALGLEPSPERAHRAWRRTFVGLYRQWYMDPAVLDAVTGHGRRIEPEANGSTRETVYFDRDDEQVLRQAARLQEYARTEWVRTGAEPPFAGRPTLAARGVVAGGVQGNAAPERDDANR